MHLIPGGVDLNTVLKGNADDGSLDGTENYLHPAFQGFTWFRTALARAVLNQVNP